MSPIKGKISLKSDAKVMVITHLSSLNQLRNPDLLFFPNHQDIFSSSFFQKNSRVWLGSCNFIFFSIYVNIVVGLGDSYIALLSNSVNQCDSLSQMFK